MNTDERISLQLAFTLADRFCQENLDIHNDLSKFLAQHLLSISKPDAINILRLIVLLKVASPLLKNGFIESLISIEPYKEIEQYIENTQI